MRIIPSLAIQRDKIDALYNGEEVEGIKLLYIKNAKMINSDEERFIIYVEDKLGNQYSTRGSVVDGNLKWIHEKDGIVTCRFDGNIAYRKEPTPDGFPLHISFRPIITDANGERCYVLKEDITHFRGHGYDDYEYDIRFRMSDGRIYEYSFTLGEKDVKSYTGWEIERCGTIMGYKPDEIEERIYKDILCERTCDE